MKLAHAKVLLTGAGGGLGSCLARQLAAAGAELLLVSRQPATLAPLARDLGPACLGVLGADLADLDDCLALARAAEARAGRVDLLINNAGTMLLGPVAENDPADLAVLLHINLLAPMLLTQALLPGMLRRSSGQIVNIGSILGTLGMAAHAAYCGSKGGLRLFSQSLRRELHGSGVTVTYVAPRAIRTPMLNQAHAKATGMASDDPAKVANQILAATAADKAEVLLGGGEPFFARLNALCPTLMDLALRQTSQTWVEITRKRKE